MRAVAASLAIRRQPAGIYVHDTLELPWAPAGRPGLHLKSVRASREAGQFLGLIGFDPMTRSGLHQHQAPAFSYFLEGTLHDYDGAARQGEMGINLAGTTHDALAYDRCVLAARLEGPVLYPPEEGADGRAHTGAREALFRNPAPEVPPDINIALAELRPLATGIGGLTRRLVFDCRVFGEDRRVIVLNLLPGTVIPAHRLPAGAEWFVLGGEVRVGDTARAKGGSFVILEPGAEAEVASEYGARLIAWADGPVDWLDGAARPDPYGF